MNEVAKDYRALPPRAIKVLVWVQVPLILLAGVVYAWVFWNVRPLLEQQEELRKEIATKQQSVGELTKQITELQRNVETEKKSVAVLREQAEQYSAALKTAQTSDPLRRVTPITALVTPRAERQPVEGKTSDGRSLYEFSAWIEGPQEVMARVAAVQWEFNHPTFRNPIMRSADRTKGFRVKYTGWGCLSSVIVTLQLVESRGEPTRLDFDMCAAL